MNVFSSSKKINTKILAVLLVLSFLAPLGAHAQSIQTYQPQTREQIIAYLYGQIAQLQALIADRNRLPNAGSNQTVSGTVSSGSSRSDVDVTTLSARNIEEDEADLRGEVDLDGEDEARVWFEYGEDDDDLDERTSKRRVTDSRGDKVVFEINIDDLDDDERYYYRAVAEDENGDVDFGVIRSFTTDDDSRSGSGGNNTSSSNNNNDFESNGDRTRSGFRLDVSDTRFDEGERVEVRWEIPENEIDSDNWVALFNEGAPNNTPAKRKRLNARLSEGTLIFALPYEGEYEFRLFLNHTEFDDEIVSREIEVED